MESPTVRTQALSLIDQYCGSSASALYSNFYQDLSDDKIISSLKQLLTEVVGKRKTEKLLESSKIAEGVK